ncbi:hypothetical protein QVD17_08517 [Tagetes erecta]|uniref:Uncharacterized protein n=1 Tax=Tagetes erecta TaxID=13708 RepID=A0AAD8P4M7_TARER|nr:hypothetical protein QVD17_08517 [Tagetes erecta]
MHSRIFGDCKSVRSDCVGRVSYLWENMYPANRWVHIQRLIEIERKRGGENVEVVEKRLRKKKPYAKEKDYSLDKEINEVQAELDAEKERTTKRKSDARGESEMRIKQKHETPVATADMNAELKSELVELKGKYADLEVKDKEKEIVITEMGRMIKDQQFLIVRIFKDLNSLKEKDGTDPAMSEHELNSLTDAAKYPLMQSGFGAKTEKNAGEEVFDEDMGIDLNVFTGPEVVVRSENVEEIDDDPKDEPEKYNVEDRDVIAWKYNSLVDAYMIKRRGGDISYIKNRKHFATLPRWDLRRLAELPLLGKEDSGRACAFEVTIRKAAENNFKDFGYQKPKRMRERVPDTQPPRLQDFLKWFYDNSTGEAILCENDIKHGARDDTRTEANLFVKVANKARGVRAELREVNERLRMTDDLNMDIDYLYKQLDDSIVQRFEKPVEVDVLDEEQTADIQAETCWVLLKIMHTKTLSCSLYSPHEDLS